MFAEELTKIKESESYADELQKKARQEAKKIIEDANAKAAGLIEEAQMRGKDAFDAQISEGQKIAGEQYALALEKTEEELKVLIENAEKNKAKTVNFIAERIVRNSVNN